VLKTFNIQKYILVNFSIFALAFLINYPVYSDDRNFVMVTDSPPKVMLYKRGLIINKWVPFEVDGFYLGDTISFYDFAKQYYIQEGNPAYKVKYFPPSSNKGGSCRISSRSLSKGKRLQFYRGSGESRTYIVLGDREDYLRFDCYLE
jgi:hypothetical protein